MYFQEHFRKPSSSDMIGTHLAHQSGFGSKGLQSLITKPEYLFKPTRRDYDIALRDFARDYKRRGFNCLDFSSMGCVRDEINIDHLMSNLQYYHNYTKAKINIAVYNDPCTKWLETVAHLGFN